ncbi:hypothetical protein [Nitrospirillum sp. BR 11163]|uniref:hypothetical protein n=1 Tax=Nitrospirillum sp. BR 11163 TaxID=3104323 RepID=UPI002AFFB5ED|nr:hypothetical protein [Nitrospirillum sp. BR 11163]MEA1675004.1 hypothetical protein [Nitrospirillum sp. BR 11163]
MTFMEGFLIFFAFGGAYIFWNLSDLIGAKAEELREQTRKLKLENDQAEENREKLKVAAQP